MKKTIKEDQERLIINEELIGDNNLIQYEYNPKHDTVLLGVRFVENSSIKEHIITCLTVHQYASQLDKIVRFNEDNTAIAIFKKENDEYVLQNFYNLETHDFSCIDFMDIEYNNKFPNNKINDRYVLIKKK